VTVQTTLLLLQLYLAHVVADFLVQPGWVVRNKRRPHGFAAHAALHVVAACAAVNIGLTARLFLGIVALAVAHVVLDDVKNRFANDGPIAFAVAQAAHLLAVGVTAVWMTTSWAGAIDLMAQAARSKRLYLYVSSYVAVVFGGGSVVQKVTQSFLDQIHANVAASKPGLLNAGKYIGWVERFLILTFVLAGYDAAVGLLLAAKAVVRYPEIKEDTKSHFAEYFLIGTLTSVGLALVAGIAIRKIRTLVG